MNFSQKIVFVLIAERDADFFYSIACRLSEHGFGVGFISFYEPAVDSLVRRGYDVLNVHNLLKKTWENGISVEDVASCEEEFGIADLRGMLLHERMTFNRHNEEELMVKSINYLRTLSLWLKNNQPALIVQELGGFIAPLALYYASKKQAIRHFFLEPMLFKGTIGFVENSISYHIPNVAVTESDHAGLRKYIERYNKEGTVVVPDKDRHHFKDATLSKLINKENFGKLWRKITNKYVKKYGQEYDAILNHLFRNFRMWINRKLLASNYQYLKDCPKGQAYVYFPLHVPLDFQLTIRSPDWIDQVALIEQISNFLPFGVELWIKEHPAAIGAYSSCDLQRILDANNIRLISPLENSHHIVRDAMAVISINSKVGAEALMQGKAVFVLGKAFYAGQGVCIEAPDVPTLRTLLRSFLSGFPTSVSETVDLDKVQDFLLRVWRSSQPGELYVNTENNVEVFTSSFLNALNGGAALSGM